MKTLTITPTKLKGTVNIPPSKSMAHRAIICASLASGKSRIDHIEYSDDIDATIKAMESLGTIIDRFDDYLIIDGSSTFTKKESYIDCKESGSTVRFMIPISIVKDNKVHLVGQGNLGKRPLHTFYEIFDRQGISYDYTQDVLDLHIDGTLKSDTFKIPGNISSQFITGLLFALPLVEGDSIIEITSSLESKGYIDLTLQMLETYGIEVINENYQRFIIKGNQQYLAKDYYVEADFSQAAFYLVAGALGNDVVLKGLEMNSKQGDKEVVDILKRMNCTIEEVADGIKVSTSGLCSTLINASQCPDVIPVVSLACTQAKGHSSIIEGIRLRIKECDRIVASVSQLSKLNANMEETKEGMEIDGPTSLIGARVSSYDDHRIAMMLAIAATVTDGKVTIENPDCVSKSYPSFWQHYKELGGVFDVSNVEE